MDFSQQTLKEYFDYSDGNLVWKKLTFPLNGSIFIGKVAGYIRKPKGGYDTRIILFQGQSMAASRAIFMWHNGWLPRIVDHMDRNPLNNLIENLRPATPSQNSKNKKSRSASTSIYLGVSFNKNEQKWKVSISTNGKKTNLGTFDNEIKAALAYNKAAVLHHKEFANLNIINYEKDI